MQFKMLFSFVLFSVCFASNPCRSQYPDEGDRSSAERVIEDMLLAPTAYGDGPIRHIDNKSGPLAPEEISERMPPEILLRQVCRTQFECDWQADLNQLLAEVPGEGVEKMQKLLADRNSPNRFLENPESFQLIYDKDFDKRLQGVSKIRSEELTRSEEFSESLREELGAKRTQLLARALLEKFKVECLRFVLLADYLDVPAETRAEFETRRKTYLATILKRRRSPDFMNELPALGRRYTARIYLSMGEDLFRKVMELDRKLQPGEPLSSCVSKFPEADRHFMTEVVTHLEAEQLRDGEKE